MKKRPPGDGQYDAFVRALRKIYKSLSKPFLCLQTIPSIPPGGRYRCFRSNSNQLESRGVSTLKTVDWTPTRRRRPSYSENAE